MDVERLLDEAEAMMEENTKRKQRDSSERDRRTRSRSPHDRRRRDDRRDRDDRDGGRPRARRSVSDDDDHYSSKRRDREPRSRDERGRRDRDRGDRYRDSYSRGDQDRERDRDRDRDRDRERDRGGHRRGDTRDRENGHRTKTPDLNEDERDARTVFVQQLAARLRTKDLANFFSSCGPVKEAQIVKDRVSGRSKGVGYVEFRQEESVQRALQLTGQKLLGIPVIVQLTEAEKNRLARNTEGGTNPQNSGVPFHRLYVGNIHFNITEEDLTNVFSPFGELEFVQLQKEEHGRSKGYGFVQFRDPAAAKEALEKMNSFELAGRPIRVGLGDNKFTNESTQSLLQKFPQQSQSQSSGFYGSGGRGTHAGGSSYDTKKRSDDRGGVGNASALNDTDVGESNLANISRHDIMLKLLRKDEAGEKETVKPVVKKAPPPPQIQLSRCVVLHNLYDAAEEERDNGPDWKKDLLLDVKQECDRSFGQVLHIDTDVNNCNVYIKFDSLESGTAAYRGLNGRSFNRRIISAEPVIEAIYNSLWSRAINL